MPRLPTALACWAVAALAVAASGMAATPPTPPAASPAAPANTPIVRQIEIRSDAKVDIDEVRELISLAVGEPMDEARTRRTLRSLRYSGVASEVEIYARPSAAGGAPGVVAVVALWTDVQRAISASRRPSCSKRCRSVQGSRCARTGCCVAFTACRIC